MRNFQYVDDRKRPNRNWDTAETLKCIKIFNNPELNVEDDPEQAMTHQCLLASSANRQDEKVRCEHNFFR